LQKIDNLKILRKLIEKAAKKRRKKKKSQKCQKFYIFSNKYVKYAEMERTIIWTVAVFIAKTVHLN